MGLDNIVRNASGSTTFSILIPRLWQKQVLVDERMKIVPYFRGSPERVDRTRQNLY